MIVFVKRSDKTLKCVLVFIGRDGAVKFDVPNASHKNIKEIRVLTKK
jgi:hypothetical protein